MVDVLAHVDVVKKVGLRPAPEVMDELYQLVVAAAAGSGVAIEVSSGGLRRESAEIFPAPALLDLFATAGVPITLASDGHAPDQAAWGHAEVVAAARAAGYAEYLRFAARSPSVTPLID